MNTRTSLLVRLLAASVLAISLSLTGRPLSSTPSAHADGDVCAQGPYACWMSDHADAIGQRPLNQVIMPASHDSGTYCFSPGTYPRTQDINLYDQLTAGMRGVDIRAQSTSDYSQYVIQHGGLPCNGSPAGVQTLDLKTVLNDIASFTNSPGAEREILYLNIQADAGATNTPEVADLQSYCQNFEDRFGDIVLTPTELVTNLAEVQNGGQFPRFASLNEIWSLPNHPRIIVEWPGCATGLFDTSTNTFWEPLQWPTLSPPLPPVSSCSQDPGQCRFNGGYYAYQGVDVCIEWADSHALPGRLRGDEHGPQPPYQFPCVYAGFGAMIGLGSHVPGLYTLSIQETGAIPTLGINTEQAVLNAVEGWFQNNQYSARGNLNFIAGDFVTDSRFSLASGAIGLNQGTSQDPDAGGPQLTASAQVVVPGTGTTFPYTPGSVTGGNLRISVSCNTTQGIGLDAGAVSWTDGVRFKFSSAASPSTLTLDLTQNTDSASELFTCTDKSGRIARLVVGPITIQHRLPGSSVTFSLPAPQAQSIPSGYSVYAGPVAFTVNATDAVDVRALACAVMVNGTLLDDFAPTTTPKLPNPSVSAGLGPYSAQGAYHFGCGETGASDDASEVTTFFIDTQPPTIRGQPQDTSVTVFDSFTLSVAASAPTFSFGTTTETVPQTYQWYHDGNLIPGATESSYRVAGAAMTDRGSYTVVVTNVAGSVTSQPATVSVARAGSALGWTQPSDLTYGTPLSSTQLDAVASYRGAPVQGTYSYSPPAGTVLDAGQHTLSVTFMPTDTTDYNGATTTAQINVLKAPLTVTANDRTVLLHAPIPTLDGSIVGIQNNDPITGGYATTATAASPVGAYPITSTLQDPDHRLGNYTVTSHDGTLTITYNICVLSDQANGHNSGSTIRIMLHLCDATNVDVSSPSVTVSATDIDGNAGLLATAGKANSGSVFRYVGGRYMLVLKTTGLTPGIHALDFRVSGDPGTHSVSFVIK